MARPRRLPDQRTPPERAGPPEGAFWDGPRPGAKRIGELHVWIATYANGNEGIMSGDIDPGFGTIRRFPFMSAVRQTAEWMKKWADQLAAEDREGSRIVSMRLVTFSAEPPPS